MVKIGAGNLGKEWGRTQETTRVERLGVKFVEEGVVAPSDARRRSNTVPLRSLEDFSDRTGKGRELSCLHSGGHRITRMRKERRVDNRGKLSASAPMSPQTLITV